VPGHEATAVAGKDIAMTRTRLIRTVRVPGLAALLLAGSSLVAGCQSDAQSGALIGAGIGALAGQAIGGDTEATLIGTAVGAGAGYVVGNESDKAKDRQRASGNYDY
jgi:outer membrane lipoprotein SlyB